MRTSKLVNMSNPEPKTPTLTPLSDAAADQAIAACGGDAREAVKALLVAYDFLEREMEIQVSRGYVRGVKHGRFHCYSG